VDRLLRGVSHDEGVRVVTAITTQTVRDACQRHEIVGAEAVILGRLLTAASLLATLTKQDDERVRIEVRGNGPLGRALADARSDGSVRGCLVTRLAAPAMPGRAGQRDTIGDLVGRGGVLAVTRDLGHEKPYQGLVQIESGELDVDIERYLATSEQLPSTLRCAVRLDIDGSVLAAAGVLCQTFPGADDSRLAPIRGNLDGAGLGDVLRHERTPQDLMGFALLGEDYRAMRETNVRFHCDCGRERALSVVSTLGADDLEALADERDGTEVKCTYCGSSYELAADDLRQLAARLRQHRS
jgi:molecular chaperone Hsp33